MPADEMGVGRRDLRAYVDDRRDIGDESPYLFPHVLTAGWWPKASRL
jgi:hypothetical protein